MKEALVLIVDDDGDLADGLAELLHIHGHKAVTASNGREAVERFRDQHFDLTFMDVRMPVINGVDAFFEIRRIAPRAQIVIMTAADEARASMALQAGAVGMLRKPFRAPAMLALIQDVQKRAG
jgi:two-component system chemotaxis response regulator CheY